MTKKLTYREAIEFLRALGLEYLSDDTSHRVCKVLDRTEEESMPERPKLLLAKVQSSTRPAEWRWLWHDGDDWECIVLGNTWAHCGIKEINRKLSDQEAIEIYDGIREGE